MTLHHVRLREFFKEEFPRKTRLRALSTLLNENKTTTTDDHLCRLCGRSWKEALKEKDTEYYPFSRGWCLPCASLIDALESSIQRRPYAYSTIPALGGECGECGATNGQHAPRCGAVE